MSERAEHARLLRLPRVERMIMLGATRQEIAVDLEVHADTVRRDIECLRSLGSDARYDEGSGHWYAEKPVFTVNRV